MIFRDIKSRSAFFSAYDNALNQDDKKRELYKLRNAMIFNFSDCVKDMDERLDENFIVSPRTLVCKIDDDHNIDNNATVHSKLGHEIPMDPFCRFSIRNALGKYKNDRFALVPFIRVHARIPNTKSKYITYQLRHNRIPGFYRSYYQELSPEMREAIMDDPYKLDLHKLSEEFMPFSPFYANPKEGVLLPAFRMANTGKRSSESTNMRQQISDVLLDMAYDSYSSIISK